MVRASHDFFLTQTWFWQSYLVTKPVMFAVAELQIENLQGTASVKMRAKADAWLKRN